MKVGDRGESCPPKLGGQPSEQSERGGWFPFGTTPARQLLLSCRATLLTALHKKSWAVIDRPYSLGCATVGALYERPGCIFCAKPAGSKKAAKRYTEAIRAVGPTLNKWRMAWKVC